MQMLLFLNLAFAGSLGGLGIGRYRLSGLRTPPMRKELKDVCAGLGPQNKLRSLFSTTAREFSPELLLSADR